jgi:hypothetical protein
MFQMALDLKKWSVKAVPTIGSTIEISNRLVKISGVYIVQFSPPLVGGGKISKVKLMGKKIKEKGKKIKEKGKGRVVE